MTSQPAPVAVCFAAGTDPGVMTGFYEALEEAQEGAWPSGNRYNLNTRWSIGVQGDPVTLRWSFVPDGLSISNGVGEGVGPSTLFASMDAKFGGNRALWISKFQEVFDRWSEVSGLKYVRVTNGVDPWDDNAVWGSVGSATRGDLRISMKNIDGLNGILAYNFFPQSGDMVIDASESWGAEGGNNYRFLRNTISHEHGHGMGVNHVCPSVSSAGGRTKLMEPTLATAFDGPQQDDIRAAHRHYGDAFEPNNNLATAKPTGASIGVGSSFVLGTLSGAGTATSLSIDANGEEDFYTLTTTAPIQLTATATPIGTTYLSGTQTSGCDTGTSVAAASIANLGIQVQTSTGTPIDDAQLAMLGLPESTTVDLPTPGTYVVRVFETDAPTQSQLYRLNLSGAARPTSTVSGRITFLDWTAASAALPVTISVRNAETQAVLGTVNTTTTALGDYSVNVIGVVPGVSYQISADGPIWIRKTVTLVAPAGRNFTANNYNLFNGDVDNSGEVDAADIDDVIAAFGQTPGSFLEADVDGSGEVDAADIDIVIANFGATDN